MPVTPAMLRSSQLAENNARPVRTVVKERSYSEETITPEISLTVSAVLAAFTILTEDLSSLPMLLYQRVGRNKFRAYNNMYYRLMHDQPNPEHSSMVFREFVLGHMLAWGNFFGQPIFDKAGDVVEIWPLRPDKMTVKRLNGERVYIYITPEGIQRVFLQEEILHIPAFGFDGLVGYSRISLARNTIGLSISIDKFGSKFFSNDAVPGYIYKHPGELGDEAYDHLKDSLEERKGVDKSHTPVILEEGMSIERLGIPPDDAQFLETKKFQVGEIARIFRVPPHMIGDVEKVTSWGSGIDAQEQGYVNHTLRPWAKRTEEYLNMQLLPKQDQTSLYYEHLMDGLLRGDIQTRYASYVQAITNGFMSRNEVREKENMNPRNGLDAMLQPLNMTTTTTTSTGGGAPIDQSNPGDDQNALAPLWRDAVARVLKRESNDLLGASKRYQAKGQQAEYEKWVEHFYSVDHAAFIKKQFQALLETQVRLFGVDTRDAMDVFISNFLNDRIEQCKSMSAEHLSESIDKYVSTAAEKFILFIGTSFADAYQLSGEDWEDEEKSYE
jgi:HK97 family phage portal protein